jgi:hypothetical protein
MLPLLLVATAFILINRIARIPTVCICKSTKPKISTNIRVYLQPAASVVHLPWYLQKDSNGRDVPTLLKLLAVKDKMIDALLREKTQPSSSSSPSLQAPQATLHAATQTPLPPHTTSSFAQCDPPVSAPNATDVHSLLNSVLFP